MARRAEQIYGAMMALLTQTIQKSRSTLLQWLPDSLYGLYFVMFYAVLGNIPFWAAERLVGIVPAGRFGVEYVAIGILALLLPQFYSAPLLIFAISIDILCGVSRTYEIPPLDCLTSVCVLGAFSRGRLASFAAVIAIALIVSAAAALFPIQRIPKRQHLFLAVSLAVPLIGGLATDYLVIARMVGRFPIPWQRLSGTDGIRAELRPRPIFRRSSLQLFQEQESLGSIESAELKGQNDGAPIPNASHLAFASLQPHLVDSHQLQPNVVLVLVESWGIFTNQEARDSIVAPFFGKSISERYQILEGAVPFHGSTVAGESRELCGKDLGFKILNESAQLLISCLPRQLQALGFHTLAAHGNSGHFFRRTDWYGRLGFNEQWFRPDFQSQGLPECVGTILGTCDAAIAQWMGTKLKGEHTQPQFVYWVTLNSHLPVPIPSRAGGAPECTNMALLSADPSLCSWYHLVSTAQNSIAALAKVDTPRPTVFVVVGDHAPPFADSKLRSLFSSTEVPYLVLIPRSIQIPSHQGDSLLPLLSVANSSTPQTAAYTQPLHRGR